MSKLNEYLEAIRHDPPPIGRKEWEESKIKKLADEQQKDKEKREKFDKKLAARRLSQGVSESKYNSTMNKVAKRCQLSGFDIMGDFTSDAIASGKFKTREDIIDELEQNAQDIAGDFVNELSNDEKIILRSRIRDLNGRLADEVHEGCINFLKSKKFEQMLKEAGIK